MRVGIVGSRRFRDQALVERAVDRLWSVYPRTLTVVSGGARGVDTFAEEAAKARGLPTIIHRLDSQEAYRAFGPDFRARAFGRNEWIVRDSDMVLAFFADAVPKGGTLNTLNRARRAGKPVHMYFEPTGEWVSENT